MLEQIKNFMRLSLLKRNLFRTKEKDNKSIWISISGMCYLFNENLRMYYMSVLKCHYF